jgi:hypothetical protein
MGNHRHIADHFDYRSDNNLRIKSTQTELNARRTSGYYQRDTKESRTDVLQGDQNASGKTSQQNRAGCFIRHINRGTDHACILCNQLCRSARINRRHAADSHPAFASAKPPATTVNGCNKQCPAGIPGIRAAYRICRRNNAARLICRQVYQRRCGKD